MPVNKSAIHFCTDTLGEFVICKMVLQAMPHAIRASFTPHYGSQLECSYRLTTYGISAALLPFEVGTNRVILDYHNQWLHSRLAAEQSNGAGLLQSLAPVSVPSTAPRAADVLFDGGKNISHQGNERLRAHVKALLPEYSTGKEKKLVVDGLISDVETVGGRFLRKQNGPDEVWEELGLEESRIKVTQMFRNLGRQRTTDLSILDGTPITDEPRPDDVVFGSRQRSRGSELLQQIISDRSKEYDSLDRGMKLKVVKAVAERVQGQGGRFLQKISGSDGLLEVSNADARRRISKYFRNKRRSSRKRVK